jgi:cobalamin biosynthesis Mg chelatase CobN
MTAPRVWKRGFVTTAAVLVVVFGAGVAQADVAFRKKAPAAVDDTGLEGSPSGGSADGTAPAEGSSAAGSSALQADDKDFPEAQAQKEKARADAALARQLKNEELKKAKEAPPFYTTVPFWVVTGVVVVGGILAVVAINALVTPDIQSCPMSSNAGCYGEGR